MKLGRKFWGFLIILAAGGAARYFGKDGLTHEDVLFLISAYGAFAFGNVVNTIAALRGNNSGGQSGAPAAPAPPPSVQSLDTARAAVAPLEVRLSEFEQESYDRLTAIMSGVELQNKAIQVVLTNLGPKDASPVTESPAEANRRAIKQYLQ